MTGFTRPHAGVKKKNTTIPAVSKLNLLRQIGNLIPEFLAPKLAREAGARAKDSFRFRIVRKFQGVASGKILRDDLIQLQTPAEKPSQKIL